MTPEKYTQELQVSLLEVEAKEMNKIAQKYGKVMETIDTYLKSSPNDFELLSTRDQIVGAKENLLKQGTGEALVQLQTELMTASDLFNIPEGESATAEAAEDNSYDDVTELILPRADLPDERQPGFARRFEPNSAEAFADQFDQDQVMQILQEFASQQKELPEYTRARLGQIQILFIVLSTELSKFEEDDESAKKTLINKAIEELEGLKVSLVENPDKSLKDLMSVDLVKALASCDEDFNKGSGVLETSGYIQDVNSIAGLKEQYLTLIDNLIDNEQYDSAQRLIEDTILAPAFEEKSKEIATAKLRELSAEAMRQSDKYVNQYMKDWMDPSPEMVAKGAKPMTYQEVLKYQKVLVSVIYDQKKREEAGKILTVDGFSDPFEKSVYEKYNDLLDPRNEWLTSRDENVDFALREIAINAPLIVASGFFAGAVRSGLGIMATRIVSSAIFMGFMQKVGLAVDATGAVIASGRLGRGILFAGRLTGAGAEAMAFDFAHMGIQGELLFSQPEWVKQVLFTGLTLGAFKFTAKQASVMDKFLTENLTKFPDKSFRSILQKVLVHGASGTATMLAVGAIQQKIMVGDFDDYDFAQEFFRALVSIGALHLVSAGSKKFIEIGKKRFSPRKGPRGFDVKTARGVETAPDGTISVKGVANSTMLRYRLVQEGYTLEPTKDGVRATSKTGEVVIIKSAPEVRAFEGEVKGILGEFGRLKNPTDSTLKLLSARLLKIMIPVTFLFSASGCGQTVEALKKIPGATDAFGGGFFNTIAGLPAILNWTIIGVSGATTISTFPTVLKGLRLLFRTNTRLFNSVEDSYTRLSARTEATVSQLGEVIVNGGRLPDGRVARALLLDSIREGLVSNGRLKPLADALSRNTTNLLNYMDAVNAGRFPFDRAEFNRRVSLVSRNIFDISRIPQLLESEKWDVVKDTKRLAIFILAAGVAINWFLGANGLVGKSKDDDDEYEVSEDDLAADVLLQSPGRGERGADASPAGGGFREVPPDYKPPVDQQYIPSDPTPGPSDESLVPRSRRSRRRSPAPVPPAPVKPNPVRQQPQPRPQPSPGPEPSGESLVPRSRRSGRRTMRGM